MAIIAGDHSAVTLVDDAGALSAVELCAGVLADILTDTADGLDAGQRAMLEQALARVEQVENELRSADAASPDEG